MTDPQGPNERPIRVLFVCTGNSARSQMAEAILRREGGGDFEVFSAGVSPRGVHPLTVRALAEIGIDISGAESKSTDQFINERFDFVVTVCDRARETCPFFPGAHEQLHWGFDDPAEATGTEDQQLAVFRRVMLEIAGRLKTFMPLARRARQATATANAGGGGAEPGSA
jgi:arsenate reductase